MLSKGSSELLRPAEVCQLLGVSRATYERNVKQRLPLVRLSPRRVGVRREAVERLLDELTTAPTAR